MAMFFGSKPVSNWTANGPHESGHDFIDQIDKQQADINAKKAEYQNRQGVFDNARQNYDDLFRNQTNYGDLYRRAKDEEGVGASREAYEKSRAAVQATNSAINNLPSSINANSNVVLNNNQRNAALGNQMGRYQNTLAYWTGQNAGDLQKYQTALASARDLASKNMGQEQTKVQQAGDNYSREMNYLNNLYSQLAQEKALSRQIYGQMYDDEYRHMQNELQAWADNLQAETSRYAQDQETARNNAKIAADKYNADAGLRLQQYLHRIAEEQEKNKAKPAGSNFLNTFGGKTKGNGWYDDGRNMSGDVKPIETYQDGKRMLTYVAPI